jgi:hypothetical protein
MAELESLGLTIREPRTGRPGKLRGNRGSWPGKGCFEIEVYIDCKREVPKLYTDLSALELMDAEPPEEVRSGYRELVKRQANRTLKGYGNDSRQDGPSRL